MEFISKYIDVEGHIGSGEQPIYLMDFDIGREYHTAQSSLLSEEIEWSITRKGDKIRIPIFAYRTTTKLDTAMWGLGIQCGMQALDAWGGKADRVFLVFGDSAHEFDDGYRVYLGLSIEGSK